MSVQRGDPQPTTWGGSLDEAKTLLLAALISSFTFDYLVRFGGRTHLTHAVLSSIPAPTVDALLHLETTVAEVVCINADFDALQGRTLSPGRQTKLDDWEIGRRRAEIDAAVALSYGLTLAQFAAVLCTFPNVDRSQPMLPGEAKSFVTRDLALLAYCELKGQPPADVGKLVADAGVPLPPPEEKMARLDVRVDAYRELGAAPYRPTPRGGRTPTDPALVEAVLETLSEESLSAAEVAEVVDEESALVAKVLKQLAKDGTVFPEGRGRGVRYYVVEEA